MIYWDEMVTLVNDMNVCFYQKSTSLHDSNARKQRECVLDVLHWQMGFGRELLRIKGFGGHVHEPTVAFTGHLYTGYYT